MDSKVCVTCGVEKEIKKFVSPGSKNCNACTSRKYYKKHKVDNDEKKYKFNLHDLRDNLLDIFFGIKDGSIPVDKAKELNNAAGKLIATYKLELTAFYLAEEKPDLSFYRNEEK